MGFLLFFIATILWVLLTPINWLLVIFKNGLSNNYFKETALDIDRFGNRNFRTLWNITLIKSEGYKFGNELETISSVLGKNLKNKTLSNSGKLLCKILNFFDKNHCVKSINNNI
jgi:hypothetical protein